MMEDTHRWSEIIPPQTALTFAAMYDPNEGIITFSGGSLLDVDSSDSGYATATTPSKYSQDSYAPREAYDDQSQVLTIDRLAYALGTGPNSAALALDQGAGLPFTFMCEALDSRAGSMILGSYGPNAWKPRPSAIRIERPDGAMYVVDGVESPLSSSSEEAQENTTVGHGNGIDEPQIEWSHLREIGSKLLSAAKTPFDGRMFHLRRSASSDCQNAREEQTREDDEGFFEDACLTATSFYTAPVLVNLNLKSAFSVTTASTSPFVHVSTPSVGPSEQYLSACSSHQNPLDTTFGANHLAVPATYDQRHDSSDTWRTPTLDAFEFLEGVSPNSPREFRRRLKKMRRYPPTRAPSRTSPSHSSSDHSTIQEPASPEEVLARHDYNHMTSPQPRPQPQLRRQKSFTAKVRKSVVERLTRLVPSGESDEESWVWVEVTHKVTQHVLSVSPTS